MVSDTCKLNDHMSMTIKMATGCTLYSIINHKPVGEGEKVSEEEMRDERTLPTTCNTACLSSSR